MCAYYRPTMYKESLYASPSEKELAIQKKKSQQLDLRDSLRQMEEARQRKKLQKLLDKADDLIYLQTEKISHHGGVVAAVHPFEMIWAM